MHSRRICWTDSSSFWDVLNPLQWLLPDLSFFLSLANENSKAVLERWEVHAFWKPRHCRDCDSMERELFGIMNYAEQCRIVCQKLSNTITLCSKMSNLNWTLFWIREAIHWHNAFALGYTRKSSQLQRAWLRYCAPVKLTCTGSCAKKKNWRFVCKARGVARTWACILLRSFTMGLSEGLTHHIHSMQNFPHVNVCSRLITNAAQLWLRCKARQYELLEQARHIQMALVRNPQSTAQFADSSMKHWRNPRDKLKERLWKTYIFKGSRE